MVLPVSPRSGTVGGVSVVGIDGCRSGWVAVVLDDDDQAAAHHLREIDDVGAAAPDAALIAIDVPIGIPDVGRREADVAARRFLGPRRNSVFFTPVRGAVEAATHAEATSASVRAPGVASAGRRMPWGGGSSRSNGGCRRHRARSSKSTQKYRSPTSSASPRPRPRRPGPEWSSGCAG